MARTGENENKDANKQLEGYQATAFQNSQKDRASYLGDLSKLKTTGSIGTDPYKNADYLGNQNRLTADSLDAAQGSAKGALESWNRRTGGLNSSVVPATIKSLSLDKARLADRLNAQRSADDYTKNLDYQRFLLGTDLAPESGDASLFGTSTSGRSSALGNLTQFGLASYGPWNSLISAAGGAAAGALSPGGALAKRQAP